MSPGPDQALGASLQELRQLLAPVVSSRIADAEQRGRLVPGDALRASGLDPRHTTAIEDWGLAALLRVMFLSWNVAFRAGFTPNDRSAVSFLRAVAERHDRETIMSTAEAERAKTEVARLLATVRALDPNVAERPAENPVEPPPPAPSQAAPDVSTDASDSSAATDRSTSQQSPAIAAASTDRPFRIVCWLKPDEAQVIVDAYTAEDDREVTTTAGTIVTARWYGDDHPEAMKYRAAVCMQRYGRSKDREPKLFWIRREEATAALEAYGSRESVDYEPVRHGKGGRAIFHPDDSPDAQRFLANVMLVRFR